MSALHVDRYRVELGSVPTAQRFHDLRKISGLTPPPSDLQAVKAGLPNTHFGVTIVDTQHAGQDGDEVGGMGRLVGDGAMMLFLSDVCVAPDHQGKGLGRHIMDALCAHIDDHCPAAYVALIGDPPAHLRVYPKYGFVDAAPSIGMYRLGAARAKALAESPESKYGKDADGNPAVPAFAAAWHARQKEKAA